MSKFHLLFIFLLFFSLTSKIYADKINRFREDLNGDGKPEDITVIFTGEKERDDHDYIIEINDHVYKGEFPYMGIVSAEIVDIDIHDNQKELLVRFDGETDDVIDNIFIFDNGIVKIAEIPGGSVSEILGDGVVTMFEWMGFWSRDKKYKLEGKYLVPFREEYTIDVNSTVSNTMILRSGTSLNSKITAELPPDSKITLKKVSILSTQCTTADGYTHECEWYFIESETGESGWIEFNELIESTMDLPWAG